MDEALLLVTDGRTGLDLSLKSELDDFLGGVVVVVVVALDGYFCSGRSHL